MNNKQKYFVVFLITCGIFATSWYLSSYINSRKIDDLQTTQNKLAVDVLSSETQFSLLEDASCTDVNQPSLTEDINKLADKINFTEQNSSNKEDVLLLKKQYSILQIKDFLLSKKIAEKCHKKINTILYFYDTKKDCSDCEKQGYVLDLFRQQNPDVKIYSFDYTLDLSSIKAMNKVYKIGGNLPSLVINGKTLNGFQSIEQVDLLMVK